MAWSKEQIAKIGKLWDEGASNRVLAAAFKVTIGAMAGVLNRNGFKRGRAQRPKKISAQAMPKHGGHRAFKKRSVTPQPKPKEKLLIGRGMPISQRKTILELTAHTCRFPFGDPRSPDFFYCGAETNGSSYCKPCEKVAYLVPQKRTNSKPFIFGKPRPQAKGSQA